MSNDREPPPRTVVTDLHPAAQLTRAVTKKGEIRFELHVPKKHPDPDLAENLRRGLFLELPHVPGERTGPFSVDEDERDKSKIVIVYRPDPKRSPRDDMPEIVRILEETPLPMTEEVREGIRQAFDALEALNARGHAAHEAARRTAKSASRSRGSR